MILSPVLRRPCKFQIPSSLIYNFLANFCSAVSGNPDPYTEIRNSNGQQFEGVYDNSNIRRPSFIQSTGCNVMLMDNDSWKFTSCLSRFWQGMEQESQNNLPDYPCSMEEISSSLDAPDADELDMMRARGHLLYKVEKSSKEFDELTIEFPKKKSTKRRDGKKGSCKEELEERETETRRRNKENGFNSEVTNKTSPPRVVLNGREYFSLIDKAETKKRNPTFNQLTGPYHQPFSLEILITKGSIRASVTHRVTSNVVAVAHSISKDMKAELSSTKNANTCAVIGRILAQRALADDIHNVIYTPRKGEKLEGKLPIVLQSIMDAGLNVTVKIKQKQRHKSIHRPSNF